MFWAKKGKVEEYIEAFQLITVIILRNSDIRGVSSCLTYKL